MADTISVPEGSRPGTSEPSYHWSCGMCHGLGLVEEESKLADCPTCETAHRFGIAFELVRRNMTPVIPASERLASPAVGTPSLSTRCGSSSSQKAQPDESLSRTRWGLPI